VGVWTGGFARTDRPVILSDGVEETRWGAQVGGSEGVGVVTGPVDWGRTDRGQPTASVAAIATFLAYVIPGRDRVLLDRRLYLPQKWCS
jgi:hypothetical protein